VTPEEIPSYQEFIIPAIRATVDLGGSAQSRQIADRVLADFDPPEEMLAITFPHRPEDPVLLEKIAWGRSYAKLIGALDSPRRGVLLVTPLGRELLAMPEDEARARVRDLDRGYRRSRKRKPTTPKVSEPDEVEDEDLVEQTLSAEEPETAPLVEPTWREALLARLHRLSPDDFEEFVLYLLRLYGLELERVGGSGDEGIDGLGTAPISAVLSSRVAVQVKRYDPSGRPVGRDVVSLFQNDARKKGAERAILVTLGRFSEPARRAAIDTTPTVDLIDGERLSDLIREQGLGVKDRPQVDPRWFDRFDRARS